MAIGEKLWEGKGKSGAGFIKSVGMEGVTSSLHMDSSNERHGES